METFQVTEQLELEIRADSVQPARIKLPITILPDDGEREDREPENGRDESVDVPKIVPGGDQMPVIILGIILLTTVLILLCFNRNTKKKKEEIMPPTPTRLPPTPRGSLTPEKPDILGESGLNSPVVSLTRPLKSARCGTHCRFYSIGYSV